MAVVTFTSPVMSKSVSVYAVAGDRGTILSIAKAHKIPIPFDCGDGECGSCVVEVAPVNGKSRFGMNLTEKEKELLRQLGKITAQEIETAEVSDFPPRHRLACQCFVRDEDIIVNFEGDSALPRSRPHITLAAAIFEGGLKITSVPQFLAYAIKVEEESALHFDQLAREMKDCGNEEVAALFQQFAGYSRLHLQEAKDRAGGMDVVEFSPENYVWPNQETPERTALWAGDPEVSKLDALKAALHGERMGFEFYYQVAKTTTDPQIKALANEFVQEEAEHVKILEDMIERESGQRIAGVSVA